MNLLRTLRTNWRDILAGLLVTLLFAFLSDLIDRLSLRGDGASWLPNLGKALSGISSFFAANLAAWLGLAVAWPTLNKFSNQSFSDVWENILTQRERFLVFLLASLAMLLTAGLCFSGK